MQINILLSFLIFFFQSTNDVRIFLEISIPPRPPPPPKFSSNFSLAPIGQLVFENYLFLRIHMQYIEDSKICIQQTFNFKAPPPKKITCYIPLEREKIAPENVPSFV